MIESRTVLCVRLRIAAVAGMGLLALSVAAATATTPVVTREATPLQAVDVGESLEALVEADWIDRDRRFGVGHRPKVGRGQGLDAAAVEAGKINSYGVTTAQDASGGCDGVKNGRWGFHVASGQKDPWWQVDLEKVVRLDRVVIYNRTDSGKAARTK